MPELRHLRAFVAVAEELNFTRAAERLHLAQQAVSKTVAGLERELGVGLLERTTREVRLTAAGASLLETGRRVVADADAAFARARTVGLGLAGTVFVGVSPSVDLTERQRVARVLRDGAPELGVSFHELRPSGYAAALAAHEVDLVLARTFSGQPGIESAALRPTPVELVVPHGHRLALAADASPGRGPVELAELDGERLVIWSPPGTPYTDLLLTRLAAAGAEVIPVESRVTGSGGAPELAADDAVAILPTGAYSGTTARRLPLAGEPTIPLLVLWPAGPPHAAVARLRARLATPED